MCPTAGTFKLTLSTSMDLTGLTAVFTNVDPDLTDNSPGWCPPTYQAAISQQGTWILYTDKNYNDDNHDDGKIQIIYQGETKRLKFQPKSVRPLTSTGNSVSLFEHKNFGGLMKTFTSHTPYLTEFPAFNKAGVSSIYMTNSRKWKFFLGPKYSGPSFTLDPDRDKFYHDSSEFFSLDERIQSFQYV